MEVITAGGATLYRTSDGQTFRDRATAEHRQAESDLEELLKAVAAKGYATIDAIAILHNVEPLHVILTRLLRARALLKGDAT